MVLKSAAENPKIFLIKEKLLRKINPNGGF